MKITFTIDISKRDHFNISYDRNGIYSYDHQPIDLISEDEIIEYITEIIKENLDELDVFVDRNFMCINGIERSE